QSLQQQAQAMVTSVSVFRTAAADAPVVSVATAAASRATVVASLASRPALAPMAARPAPQIAAATPAKAPKTTKTTTADDEEWAAF
ncbi:MAG: methyl-accepting chemotaxis protein, partial [Delftia acidovorans]|nr:methyl-accepting chemotaxis protein [Delftia acidovorans]